MKILSIDWDYFYPDSTSYDWGAHETEFYMSEIWKLRVADVNLITHVPILKEYVPKVPRGFWKRMVSNEPLLFVTDSHKDIATILIEKGSIVINLDAHHDFGYPDAKVLACDTWAKIAKDTGLIKEYHLVYPVWRKGEDESDNFAAVKASATSISYALPVKQDYDIIFICRSGAWTPPWHDKKFFKFVSSAPHRSNGAYCIEPRPFDLKQAIKDEEVMCQKIFGKTAEVKWPQSV